MIFDHLNIGVNDFTTGTGWEIKSEGACKGDVCIPLERGNEFDLRVVADRLAMALVHDATEGLWALGPASIGGRALVSAEAPELVLPDFDGNEFELSSLRGQKVALVSWAPYCGCRYDLPGWQTLHEELHPAGLEVVTVCLELEGAAVARPFIEAAKQTHHSLLDETHQMDALFGVMNIPTVTWIDEQGMIVRPPEAGWPPRVRLPEWLQTWDASENAERPRELRALGGGQDWDTYPDAIRDWVAKGAASRFALTSAEVVARSQPRPIEASQAAAEFELANHLWRQGHRTAAISHFNASYRLEPDNWTYKRQAWSVVGRERESGEFQLFAQGPTPGDPEPWPFDSDFVSDVAKLNEGEYFPKTL
jgi:hypothetical protein